MQLIGEAVTVVLQKQNRCSDWSCLQPKHWTKRTALGWSTEMTSKETSEEIPRRTSEGAMVSSTHLSACSCSSPLVPHGCSFPWNLPSFDTLNFPILLCEKRDIIHLFIQQCLLLLLQNYPFHFAEYHCVVHFLFFILLKSLLFIFTSCPIFILLSIFPILMAPLIFSRLSFNFFPSKFNLS